MMLDRAGLVVILIRICHGFYSIVVHLQAEGDALVQGLAKASSGMMHKILEGPGTFLNVLHRPIEGQAFPFAT